MTYLPKAEITFDRYHVRSHLSQARRGRARGYRTNRNFIAMIYLIVGKLNAGPAIA